MQKIIDNKIHGTVGDKLKSNIKKSTRLSVISELFSIWPFAELKKELEKIDDFRLIVPNLIDKDNFISNLLGSNNDRKFRNNLNASKIAKECANWLEKKAQKRKTDRKTCRYKHPN